MNAFAEIAKLKKNLLDFEDNAGEKKTKTASKKLSKMT